MAVLLPHVILSRYGFRAVSQSLMEALTVALLWRALRTGRWPLSLAAGLSLGLTGYTYLPRGSSPFPWLWRWAGSSCVPPVRRAGGICSG
jgi:hypothetical protein